MIDLAGTTVRDDGAVEGAFVDALRTVGALRDGRADEELLRVVRSTMGMSKIVVFRDMLGEEGRAQSANAAFETPMRAVCWRATSTRSPAPRTPCASYGRTVSASLSPRVFPPRHAIS